MRAGRCLGLEGNGVSLGVGGEGGPGPLRSVGDKQSVRNEGRDNMDKDEEGTGKSGVMKKDQSEHSEPFFSQDARSCNYCKLCILLS
jgi:hypothetical protein